MVELVDKSLHHCDVYYVDRAGNPASTLYEMTPVTSTLADFFGEVLLEDSGPFSCGTTLRLFSPKGAEDERHGTCEGHRRPSQKPNAKKTDRVLGDHYDHTGLAKAMRRVSDQLKIPRRPSTRTRLTRRQSHGR